MAKLYTSRDSTLYTCTPLPVHVRLGRHHVHRGPGLHQQRAAGRRVELQQSIVTRVPRDLPSQHRLHLQQLGVAPEDLGRGPELAAEVLVTVLRDAAGGRSQSAETEVSQFQHKSEVNKDRLDTNMIRKYDI